MKNILCPVCILIFAFVLNACEKSAPNTIVGKWKVISDSSITSGASVFYKTYNGAPLDYFEFTANGILYIKEGSAYDTVSCKQKSDSTITFTKTGANINAIPETGYYKLSNHTLKITVTPDLTNPGFGFIRVIYLRR